ncbi:hypothetical protein GCM10009105_36880 [Dokdonella soli]|uniref:Secreted protein n=1 Tax=Dokdonella soli TaxID=529810 RepID=A0ABP3U6F4_9GAMM
MSRVAAFTTVTGTGGTAGGACWREQAASASADTNATNGTHRNPISGNLMQPTLRRVTCYNAAF